MYLTLFFYSGDGNTLASGRPRIEVKKEDIKALRALNSSWTKIARMLGISQQTLYRRLYEYGIPSSDYCAISCTEHELIMSIKRDHPNDGEVLIQGHTLSLGI